ncbi:MAG: InlB B-repeat-containing protein, partial [Eubacterium sp.]|nr:InlB B-repeat-containing protein [Eubacterium sp.]
MIAKKRLLPILVAVLMVFAMMPMSAGTVFAEEVMEPITVINECGDDGNTVLIRNADGEDVSNVPAGSNIVITFTGGSQLDPEDPNYNDQQGGSSSGRPVYLIITANADGSELFNEVVSHNQMESIMVPAGGVRIRLTYGDQQPDTCSVVFDANGGALTDGASDTISVASGETITLPAAEREGFVFEGWYDGDTRIGSSGDSYTVSDDAVLQAHWKEAPFVVFYADWFDAEQKMYLDENNIIIDDNDTIPPIGTELNDGIVIDGYYSDIEYTKPVDINSRIPDELIGKRIYIKLTSEHVVIYVQGVEVTKENRTDVLGDQTVSFDYDTMTLTLKNADITDTDKYPAVGIGQYTPVTIRLEGENTITGSYLQEDNTYGIISYSRLKICGPGSLNVSMENTGGTYVYGIYSDDNDLTISADLDIRFSAGTGGYQCGIIANKIVFDNARAAITALDAEDGPVSYGIASGYGGVTLKGDSD